MTTASEKPVWFITGCSSGFGHELAKQILEKGWNAVITARNIASVEDLVQGYSETSLLVSLDITNYEQVKAAVSAAHERFGRIDVLVNNAGYGYFTSVEEGEEARIRQQFETNFFGLVHLTQEVLPGMRNRRAGTIVILSSIGGLVGWSGTGFYHATKFALEGLSESLQLEVAPLGIKVLIVEPGPFRTEFAGKSRISTPTNFEDYEQTVGVRIEQSTATSGKQNGDPVRGTKAIIEAVESGIPYQRLLLGKLAYDQAMGKLDALRANFEAWHKLSVGVDFPEE